MTTLAVSKMCSRSVAPYPHIYLIGTYLHNQIVIKPGWCIATLLGSKYVMFVACTHTVVT